jgi:menaquinone-dependent protoporphyrinogen oxidase
MTRVLVAFATKHHSTAEIAEAIAARLRDRGLDTDCRDAGAASTDGYDAVVLGSAVYMGRWRREARRFLKHERRRLADLPFWVFSSGPVGEPGGDPEKDAKWLEPGAVMELVESLGAREHVIFGGRVPEDPGGFVEKAMSRNTPPELQDLRDWDVIRRWADTIADALSGPMQEPPAEG